jgi:hypothetical protein
MWGTSSPDDKLTGDLGNVIESTQIGGRSVGLSYGVKIITGQFWAFATISAMNGLMLRESPHTLVRYSLLMSRDYFPLFISLSLISWAFSWAFLFAFRAS